MDKVAVAAIAAREARTGLRSRWFLLYAAVFAVLSIGFSTLALSGSDLTGQPGFGRTSAGLLNLMLLIVPLIGLTVGALSLAGERHDGNLDYLLAQPVSPGEIYVGKYLGAALSLVLMLLLGFGGAAVVMAFQGGTAGISDFALLIALTLLLGLAMLSVGYAISSRAPQTSAAFGIAVTLWLVFVIIGDLGLMSSAIVMDISPQTLLGLTLLNPLDVFKLLSVDRLQTSLDVLGPAGSYALERLGAGLTPVLLGLMALWVILPLPFGYWLFKRTDFR
ncbi:MAG TPA: ABC transporter permease subunit [Thermomicrobiales bacterium]|nr:ABC transporter permease subunit [Thermomicrobiales bacterium]